MVLPNQVSHAGRWAFGCDDGALTMMTTTCEHRKKRHGEACQWPQGAGCDRFRCSAERFPTVVRCIP
jgi:hypothetical protein